MIFDPAPRIELLESLIEDCKNVEKQIEEDKTPTIKAASGKATQLEEEAERLHDQAKRLQETGTYGSSPTEEDEEHAMDLIGEAEMLEDKVWALKKRIDRLKEEDIPESRSLTEAREHFQEELRKLKKYSRST